MLIDADVTRKILNVCFEVSNELGSGFLESVYKHALLIALNEQAIKAQLEFPIQVRFRKRLVGLFYADLVIEDRIILEVKAGRCLLPEHEAQLLNYLRAGNFKIGLIINFGKPKLEWKRMVM